MKPTVLETPNGPETSPGKPLNETPELASTSGKPLLESVNTADPALRQSISFFREMFRDLTASRELAWRLFLRDIRAQYRQSILGYLWVLLPPLITTIAWVFLNTQGVLKLAPTGIPYAVYVLTGVILWEAFISAVNAPLLMVTNSVTMLAKIKFPREALILAAFGQVLFNTIVRLVLLVGVFAWCEFVPASTVFLAPIGILALLLMGTVIGVLLVPWGVLYQDVSRTIVSFTTIWFFLTPVVYAPPTTWPASLLVQANPVSPLIITARQLLTTGELTHFVPFLVVSTASMICLFVGWVSFRIAMPHLIARISA